ncbi:MAG: class I SAM-dependent RNA methyltransferase [Spirochaetaceae bacterium]
MGEVREGRVERVVAGGLALLRSRGEVCFVPGALPQELVRYEISGKRRGVLQGELRTVLEASPNRVEPPCRYYRACGGCELQEMAYEQQLSVKAGMLVEQLKRLGGFDQPRVREIRYGASYGYRTRVRMHRSGEGGYGFRRRRSREVVPVERCIVATEGINEKIPTLRGEGDQVLLSESDDGVLLSGSPEAETTGAVTLLGRTVHFSRAGFFQSNLALFERLLEELIGVVDWGQGGRLYDLYAGSAAISSVVASKLIPKPEEICCVESDSRSADLIADNLCELAHTVYREPVERFVRHASPPCRESVVILDPPRAGLSPAVRGWLAAGSPRQLCYISCDPATFARDLGDLKGRYTLEEVIPFDFFPQTSHVESLALLTPRGEGDR